MPQLQRHACRTSSGQNLIVPEGFVVVNKEMDEKLNNVRVINNSWPSALFRASEGSII